MNQQGHSQQHLLQLCHFRLRARFAAVDCIGPDEGCREWMDQDTYNILLYYICVHTSYIYILNYYDSYFWYIDLYIYIIRYNIIICRTSIFI